MERDGSQPEIVVGELVRQYEGPRAMVFQKDLDRAAVGEERYQLALALRELAQRLGISLTRYAARVTWDRSSLSRFFSGIAVPPADFVEQLIADGDRALGAELTPAVCELVRGLHRTALTVANPKGAQLQRLRDELADAERQNGLLQQEQRLLRDMVIAAKQQIEDRDAKIRAVEASATADRITHRAELAQRSESFETLREERDRLRAVLEKLRGELADTESRAAKAERRCVELENRLEAAEEGAGDEPDGRLLRADAAATAAASAPYHGDDVDLRDVITELQRRDLLGRRVVGAVTRAMDQVVDAARTGRVRLDQLPAVELASLTAIVANHLQYVLRLSDEQSSGLVVAGRQVRFRFALTPAWAVAPEESDDLFLLVEVNEAGGWWRIGVARATPQNLAGPSEIHWLHHRVELEPNVLGFMTAEERRSITAAGLPNDQLGQLFRMVQLRPIDRRTVQAIARTESVVSRALGAAARLAAEGIIVLTPYSERCQEIAAELGLPVPRRNSRNYLAARLVHLRPDHGSVPSVELAGERWCVARPEDAVEALPPGHQLR
ncbi:NaeI family type II restriction endonuclease [Kitasatospora griseola]|uniref:NaeI family type II restriction endonuclease n=1 Tax=Kitasatospora griseola TaxID=2064 RepID=UPI0016701777|nr:NaeI family type II restriction endonuclease [Kitasatospora griseola]